MIFASGALDNLEDVYVVVNHVSLPTKDEIAALSPVEDMMETMADAATLSHNCGKMKDFKETATKMVEWTMKYGVDVYSSSAFAFFGMTKLNKNAESFETAALWAKRGSELLENFDENDKKKAARCRFTYVSQFFVYPWSKAIHPTLEKLLEGYQDGIGEDKNAPIDVTSALWCRSVYMCSSIVAGTPLDKEKFKSYIEEMKTHPQQVHIRHMSLPFYQMVLNLVGDPETENVESLEDWEEWFETETESSLTKEWSRLHLQICKSMMCNYFGQFEIGATLALERGDDYDLNGSPLAMTDALHRGVSLYAMARQSARDDKRNEKRRYRNAARIIKQKVAGWVDKGNKNAMHILSFLKAENAALKPNQSDDAKMHYEEAINFATNPPKDNDSEDNDSEDNDSEDNDSEDNDSDDNDSEFKFLHDAALISERYAEYLLMLENQEEEKNDNEVNDDEENDDEETDTSAYYFQKSFNYYQQWGSVAKLDQLRVRYPDLFPAPDA